MTTNSDPTAEPAATPSQRRLVYSPHQAAAEMSVGVNELRRMIREGELGHIRTPGGRYKIPHAAIEEWIAANTVAPQS